MNDCELILAVSISDPDRIQLNLRIRIQLDLRIMERSSECLCKFETDLVLHSKHCFSNVETCL
jgi:hypothetical protein